MHELLDKIDHWISTNRPHYYALLQPGATSAELDALEDAILLKLPPEFRELYAWHNGQDPMAFESIEGNWSFMSLDEIRNAKEVLDGMIGFDFDDPKHWRRGWVPFLHNGGGSHLCIDVTAEDGGHPGQLVEFWKADSDRPIAFASVSKWLDALWLSMTQGTLDAD